MASTKTALLILPSYNFRDEEYQSVRDGLEKLGYEVKVASTVRERAGGIGGSEVDPEKLIDEVDPAEYAVIVFIGGPGACQYWHDAIAQEICRRTVQNGQLLGALSHATVALATAGILKGKKATGHASVFEKVMTEHAEFTGEPVERDGSVITGEGGRRVGEFVKALIAALNENP